jgi:hypothetical protein
VPNSTKIYTNLKGDIKMEITISEKLDIKNEDSQLNIDIKKLTKEDYKTDLNSLKELKFEKTNWFDLERDNFYKETIGDNPKYVDFNSEPYPYDKALIKAINELHEMFSNCKSYKEARNTIVTIDPLNLCSEERGYCTAPNTTGKFYGCWVILWGCDEDETIEWDVRWY